MSDFDDELSRFLAAGQEREELRQEHELTRLKFEQFLNDRGIDLSTANAEQRLSSDEIAARKTRQVALISIVAIRMQLDVLEGPDEEIEHARTEAKKYLQAFLMINEYEQPWLELIDHMFEGESMGVEDLDLLQEAAEDQDELSAQAMEDVGQLMSAMREILSDGGLSIEVDSVEAEAVTNLAVLRVLHDNRVRDESVVINKEAAHIMLAEFGLGGPTWDRLIDQFFHD